MADTTREKADVSLGSDAAFGADAAGGPPAPADPAAGASADEGTASDDDILSQLGLLEEPTGGDSAASGSSVGSDAAFGADAAGGPPAPADPAAGASADEGTASDDDILSQLGLLEKKAGAARAASQDAAGSDGFGAGAAEGRPAQASDDDMLRQRDLHADKARVDREDAVSADELSKASIDFEGLDIHDDLEQLDAADAPPAVDSAPEPDDVQPQPTARRSVWRYGVYGGAGILVLAVAVLTGALLVSRPPTEPLPVAPADDLLPPAAEPVVEDGITAWQMAPFVVPTDTSNGRVRLLRITLSLQLEFVSRQVIVRKLTAIRSQVYDRLCGHDLAAFQSRDERARIAAALAYDINAALDADLVKTVTVTEVTVL